MKKQFKKLNRKNPNTIIYFVTLFILFFILLSFFSRDGSTVSLDQHRDSSEERFAREPITIIFAGDINFDRYVRRQAEIKDNYNYIFDDVRDIFQKADLVVANSEGPITDNKSKSMGSVIGSSSNYFFTFPPETAKVLYDENVRLVNLGNNHIYNFGTDGLEQTRKYLEEADVDYFGHTSKNQSFEEETLIKDFGDYKVMFVNYNQFIDTDRNELLANIETVNEEVDFIILYTHWGLEYRDTANIVMQNLAHDFVDAGVDLIIGSHPHVVQQSEVYRGKTIYYSLGNFIFDQYFDRRTREGLLVEVEIDPRTDKIEFREYKTFIQLDSSVTLIE